MFHRLFLSVAFALLGSSIDAQLESEIRFEDISDKVNLKTNPAWKYGGPCVADLNNDGHYDLLLGNHDREPVHLFWGKRDHTFVKDEKPFQKWDVHGIAAGDFDLDGDMDVVVSMGGGNGKNPKPPRIKRNDGSQFVDITDDSGIAEMGARGRSPRWVDVDCDGYLDLLHINAAQADGEQGPRNIVFKNNGDGTFSWKRSPEFENADAERVLVTDFNGDHLPDLILFTCVEKIPFTLWQGNKNFVFKEVTNDWLDESLRKTNEINAICEADFDNDGDLDYYLARGKTYYKTANNSFSFDEKLRRLDLRDEGNKSYDGISFVGDDKIVLEDFFHWKRGPKKVVLPVYLGKSKTRLDTPVQATTVQGVNAVGFPESTDEDGWFLGYLGNGKWRLEWNLSDNLAWDIRASVIGVDRVESDWEPRKLGVADVLLRNDGTKFSDASDLLPPESDDNNWGVVGGDFNNDGFNDFFVYRFGEMMYRIPDALLVNRNGESFVTVTDHGANVIPEKSHGDMGAAFDFDFDGNLDLLSGDDDNGKWRLFKNVGKSNGNWIGVHVGYSKKRTDPLGAEVEIITSSGRQIKRVGAGSAAHSQSALNLCHFGIGKNEQVSELRVRWRDGTMMKKQNQKANQVIVAGTQPVAGNSQSSAKVKNPGGPYFADPSQDPKPADKSWVPVTDLSDDFDGDEINTMKWQTEPIGNGWGWLGRPPGLFRAENVEVLDGNLNVTVSTLPEPQTIKGQNWLYQGAIVRSKHQCEPGWYYETRMKANKTAMSSTFWLMSNESSSIHRQELDIQECVGFTSELTHKWGRSWNQIFHSNMIRTERGVDGKVQIQDSVKPPTPNYERFYVYGAWWKSPREVQFFFDGKYAYSLRPDVDWDMPAFIQMAIETYDWNPVPEGGGLIRTGTWEERTTKYDWVRVWRLN